jgi:hypothetical protein
MLMIYEPGCREYSDIRGNNRAQVGAAPGGLGWANPGLGESCCSNVKMSPRMELATGVVEFGLCVIDRDLPFERFVDLHFGPGEAEAFRLGRDVERSAVPLHDVVVADAAFVHEAADAIEIFGSGTPGGFCRTRSTSEAAVVVGQEMAQHSIGAVQIGGASQAEFAGEAVLKSAPETFDASLGLWRVRGDVGDTELRQGPAELSGLAFAGELFGERPVIVVADKDAVAIAVETKRHAIAPQHAPEQAEIAASVFGEKELGSQDLAGGVVEKAKQGEFGAAVFQPAVQAGVE